MDRQRREMKRSIMTTLALTALALAACDGTGVSPAGGSAGTGAAAPTEAPADPAAVITAWLTEECPTAAEASAATGLDLTEPNVDAGGAQDGFNMCMWGDVEETGGGGEGGPLVYVRSMEGELGDPAELRQGLESDGGTVTDLPHLGPDAFSAHVPVTDTGAGGCIVFMTTGSGEGALTLQVSAMDPLGTDPAGLCDAAENVISLRG